MNVEKTTDYISCNYLLNNYLHETIVILLLWFRVPSLSQNPALATHYTVVQKVNHFLNFKSC